jgi:predicted site-specific integrase-resolvase
MPDLLTVREYAERYRIDPETVRRWIREGLVKVVRLPHREGHRSLIRIPVGKEG